MVTPFANANVARGATRSSKLEVRARRTRARPTTLEQILGPACRRCDHPRRLHRGGRGKCHALECAVDVVRGWASGSRCEAFSRGRRANADLDAVEAKA
jgi:hypothetical protein